MPRAQKKQGGPVAFLMGDHELQGKLRRDRNPLSGGARRNLLSILGFDYDVASASPKALDAIKGTEDFLASYRSLVSMLDNAPRSREYIDTLRPVQKAAEELAKTIGGLNDWGYYALVGEGLDPRSTVRTLKALSSKVGKAIARSRGDKNGGRPTREALRVTIRVLRDIFYTHYQGPRSEVPSVQGSARNLTEYENDEVEFISAALDAAGITHAKDLRSYFQDMPPPREFRWE